MSGIIWGIADLKNNSSYAEQHGQLMIKPMKEYKIDRYSKINYKNVYFGCGLQYITEESVNEIVPIKDGNLLLTCDAIIDNREELLEEFGFNNEKSLSDLTDSEYILYAYKKWGRDCVNHLEGDFAFAIYDEKKRELFCTRDHVGKRTLYYYYKYGKIVFCTLIKPILEVIENRELNEKWIAEYLAVSGVLSCAHIKETMYKGICQLPPSTYMVVNKNKISFKKYWNPEKDIKIVTLASEEDYVKKFKKVFKKAVACRTRSRSDVGIMLSSGLDSTAVAAYAAPQLDKEKKLLKSFTSVPTEGNKEIKVKDRNSDETYGVNLMINNYKNIFPEFCSFEGENVLNSCDEKCAFLEMPYKAIENFSWYTGIAGRAAEEGCSVLLDGQYGNLTISYGEFYTSLLTMIKSLHFKQALKELVCLNKKYHIKVKDCMKIPLKLLMPYGLRKKRFESKNKHFDKYKLSPINKELLAKYNVDKTLNDNNLNSLPERFYDWNEVRKLIVNPIMFSHVAEYETKVGLKYGILKRDPTRDKNLIELILSFPVEQFAKDAEERNLVRKAMKGLVPDEILSGRMPRGIQAADWVERLRSDWQGIHKNLVTMMNDDIAEHYFDIEKLNKYIGKFKQIPKNYNDSEKYEIRMIISAYIFYKYICKFKESCNEINNADDESLHQFMMM